MVPPPAADDADDAGDVPSDLRGTAEGDGGGSDGSGADRFRGVLLTSRAAPAGSGALPVRYSRGAARRAAQLQRFLGDLQRVAAPQLEPAGRIELLVLAAPDWRRLYRYPYGLPFARTRGGSGHGRPAAAVDIVAAADYPGRLLHSFDGPRLAAARRGIEAPGDVREFLDLLLGHEWGHALANSAGVRTRVRWLDELLATYLFLLALREAGGDGLLERFLAWARLGRTGAPDGRSDLGAFERRRRLSVAESLWYQGVFTERAASLLHHGWELPRVLRAALPADRGEVARELLAFDPSFRRWFASFAPRDPSAADRAGADAAPDG